MPRRPDLIALLRWSGPALLLLALVLLRGLGDRWWGALPLLFGPRWLLLILVPVPLVTVRNNRRLALIATLLGVLLYVAIIDFRLPWRALVPAGDGNGGGTITLVEWNSQGGGDDPSGNLRALLAHRPDAVVIAECRSGLQRLLSEVPDHTMHSVSDVCFLTPHPVVAWEPLDPEAFWRDSGSGAIGRMVIEVDGQEVVVGGVHLETPREALEELFFLSLRGFIAVDAEKRVQRDVESQAARQSIAPRTEVRPLLIAGDFNLVVESAIYRRWWGDLTNVFSSRGLGLGWTKRTKAFGVRIDHVLVGNGVTPVSVRLGEAMGSDHRPVIAIVRLPSH